MTKQEEIREGIEVKINRFDTFRDEYSYESFADEILKYLDSQGVVIKVDRGLPAYASKYSCDWNEGFNTCWDMMAGREAVEPLIKEE